MIFNRLLWQIPLSLFFNGSSQFLADIACLARRIFASGGPFGHNREGRLTDVGYEYYTKISCAGMESSEWLFEHMLYFHKNEGKAIFTKII